MCAPNRSDFTKGKRRKKCYVRLNVEGPGKRSRWSYGTFSSMLFTGRDRIEVFARKKASSDSPCSLLPVTDQRLDQTSDQRAPSHHVKGTSFRGMMEAAIRAVIQVRSLLSVDLVSCFGPFSIVPQSGCPRVVLHAAPVVVEAGTLCWCWP